MAAKNSNGGVVHLGTIFIIPELFGEII